MLLILLGPVAVHVGGELWWSWRVEWVKFGSLDFLLQLGVLGYVTAVFSNRRRPRMLARLGLLVAALGIAVAAGEFAARILSPVPPANLPQAPRRQVAEAGDALPGVSGRVTFTVNQLGLRGRPMSLAELRRIDHKILCVGASTTQCIGVSDEHAWPERLNQALSRRVDGSVYVGNAGVQGYATPHCMKLLRDYAPAAAFDWVVALCVYPDVVTMFKGNFEKRNRDALNALTVGHDHRPYYSRSSLYQRVAALLKHPAEAADVVAGDWSGWMERARARRRSLKHRHVIRELPPELEAGLTDFRRNVQAIIRTCQARGQRVLLLTHAQIHDTADLPPDLERQLGGGWYDESGLVAGEITQEVVGRYNLVLKQVAAEYAVDVLDLDAALAKDASMFFDDYHFNIAGCDRVAALLADYFAPVLSKESGDGTPAPTASVN